MKWWGAWSYRSAGQSTRTFHRSVAGSSHGQGMRGPHTGARVGNRAAAWTHGFQAMSRSASSVAQACVRRRGRTLVWPDGVQSIAPKAPPTPSARSPHECARDPPVGCASAAGLLLCVRSDGTVSHVAPPAPPRGVAPRPPGQGDGSLCRRSTRVSKGNDFSGKKGG